MAILSTELYAYVAVIASVVIANWVIIVIAIFSALATFKRPLGQVMNGRLLSLSRQAMVVVLNGQLITLRTLVSDKPADCLLDSGASHNFLSVAWCNSNGIEYEEGDWFNVRLADGQEVPAVGKLRCFVDLGPMTTALTFYVLDCSVPCVLGIPFLQTVNPTIDWANRSVSVTTTAGLCPLEVVSENLAPQCDIVSAKQFEKGLRKGQYVVDGCFGCRPDG